MLGVHDVKTRRIGDMILVEAHLEVDAGVSVREGYKIALEARRRVVERRDVLNLMTHLDAVDMPI
jgi:divalent metal cation (Fe/Co/Zn/Cd) transporter